MRLTKARAREFVQYIEDQFPQRGHEPQEVGEERYNLVSVLYRSDVPQFPADEGEPV